MSDTPMAVVAGAVLSAEEGEPKVLLAKRAASAHQGGKWEFPGGKMTAGESAAQTLVRELEEEIGIQARTWQPLIRFPYAYPEFEMDFEVFRVTAWDGAASGREGQEVRWVPLPELRQWTTPPASLPVIRALQLPARYAISADPAGDMSRWQADLSATLERGAKLIQLRAHSLSGPAYEQLAQEAIGQVHAANARIVLNCEPEQASRLGADGVHLTSARLMRLDVRPLPEGLLVGTSCHSPRELDRAVRIDADFAVLSPLRDSPQALGWEGFASAIADAALPVYALGGMNLEDQDAAVESGAQGIAAIRGLWGQVSRTGRR